jgi:hypothetical protein
MLLLDIRISNLQAAIAWQFEIPFAMPFYFLTIHSFASCQATIALPSF